MRPHEEDVYEYIGTYVDDLAMAMKNPQEFIDILKDKYKFKLKGSGPIEYHLGSNFFRDEEGILHMSATKYIDRMVESYQNMFGEKPKRNIRSPLEKGDHPELDTSELLDQNGIQQFQSLIGSLQWALSIGRVDIATAVMTLSSYRVAPRRGHLDRAKRIVGYLSKMQSATIAFKVWEPDYSDLPIPIHDWERTVYGEAKEPLPHKFPKPMGNYVTTTSYVDANLMHDLLSGRSAMGILHFANQTLMDWTSKKLTTVETATYGTEFVAARVCTDQIIELRNWFRYLGVPVRDISYMFGDNESVVKSSTFPDAKLNKRHNILSFHRVREMIAAKVLAFTHICGKTNPADMLSKNWSYGDTWKTLRPILFSLCREEEEEE